MSERDIVERMEGQADALLSDKVQTSDHFTATVMRTGAAEIRELRRQAEESAASAAAEVEKLRAEVAAIRADTIEACAKVAEGRAIAPMGEDCCAVAYGIADALRSLTKRGGNGTS